MFLQISRALPVAALMSLMLAGCGGGEQTPPVGVQVDAALKQGLASIMRVDAPVAGVTPFIAFVSLHGLAVKSISSVNFRIAGQAGTVSKPVSVTYTLANLVRRAYARTGATVLTVPVFGLYPGATNDVTINLQFSDGSTAAIPVSIATAAWVDPHQTYDHPTILKARAANVALGFDFFYMKSAYGSPVVVDTDGRVRWVGPSVVDTISATFDNGGFVLGSNTNADLYRIEFDGTYMQAGTVSASGATVLYHDIEAGKTGYIGNVDGTFNGVFQVESTAEEFSANGSQIATWDVARILSDVMTAGGDDPSRFVRPGVDWFHMNTAIYDAADDSVIVSSRENFVIKLDYATGSVRWILGDPTKYWYTFPSLRAKSLTWVGDGLVPIGQHSVGIAHDGSLMLFNNGYESGNQPAGAPAGQSRAYSAVSDYVIDEAAGTVTEAWHFDYGQTISSTVCSSARDTPDGSVLVDYAVAENQTAARVVGLLPSHDTAFDFRFATSGCSTSWNAQVLALDAMTID